MKRVVSTEIINKVILPKRVIQNPEPRIYKNGDCGACVLAGLFNMEVKEVYEKRQDKQITPFSRDCLKWFLYDRQAFGSLDRFIMDVPHWNYPDSLIPFGNLGWLTARSWFNYVRMGIDAGYYGIAFVRFDKKGTTYPITTDHIVLICGVRDRYVPHKTMEGASTINQEILVSCSAKKTEDEEWVKASEFLRERGGYNIILVRPL